MNSLKSCELNLNASHREIPFTIKHAASAMLLAGSLYAVIAVLALLLSRNGLNGHISLALIHGAGALSLFLFWKGGRWGKARYDSFGAALLLFAIAFRIHALLDALIYGTRLDNLARYPNLPIPTAEFDLLLKGEVITVLAFLLVACSWRLQVGKNVERHSFIKTATSVPPKISLLVYGAAFAVDVIRRLEGVSLGPLTQMASLMFVTGVAAIYFMAARKSTPIGRVGVACLMALPLFLLALSGGMKEQMFFPFVPAGILFWVNYHSQSARIAMVCVLAVLLAISQLYVHHVRQSLWFDTRDVDISTMTLVSSFMESIESENFTDAFDAITSRVNLTTSHATTVLLADYNGHEPVEVFGMIPASVIPRILWPDKPTMQPGAMHTARILGHSGPVSEMTSATAAGFGTELYLGGWWVGVFFGALAYGWLLASAQNWASRFGFGFAHHAFCFVVLYWTIRFDEKHIVYAYTSIIFLVIFLWMLAKITSTVGIKGAKRMAGVQR